MNGVVAQRGAQPGAVLTRLAEAVSGAVAGVRGREQGRTEPTRRIPRRSVQDTLMRLDPLTAAHGRGAR